MVDETALERAAPTILKLEVRRKRVGRKALAIAGAGIVCVCGVAFGFRSGGSPRTGDESAAASAAPRASTPGRILPMAAPPPPTASEVQASTLRIGEPAATGPSREAGRHPGGNEEGNPAACRVSHRPGGTANSTAAGGGEQGRARDDQY